MKEIDRQIKALEKMMGKNVEYDKGIFEGISALEYVNETLGANMELLKTGLLKDCESCKAERNPSVTPTWIPTSERQPEGNGNYLAYYHSTDGTDTLEFMMVDHCNAGGGWLHEESGKKFNKKVVAWLPLPEPYKAGK